MLPIIQSRKTYFIISSILVIASIAALSIWGLVPAIDFTGGSLMEVEFSRARPTVSEVRESLSDLEIGEVKIQPTGEQGMLLRFKDISEETHQQILEKLGSFNEIEGEDNHPRPPESNVTEHKFTSIGPIVGQELKKKTTFAMILVVVCIILYIAWAFRKVSKPVQSWKYGLTAIIALVHDVLIVSGIFAVLGHFFGFEVDVLFVTALLTILGYSVNDTIVVFDRIRENLFRYQGFDFEDTVNRSVNETVVRSLNTSITTLLVLFSIFLFGGASIKQFILALICGAMVGTYSSIFLASPLLVVWERLRKR